MPFVDVYDARCRPYSSHWNMQRIDPANIEFGDTAVVECSVAKTCLPHATSWSTELDLMGIALIRKH